VNAPQSRADLIRELEREFPAWHVWMSSAGRPWAVQRGPRPRPRIVNRTEIPVTFDTDDFSQMRAQLREYADLTGEG